MRSHIISKLSYMTRRTHGAWDVHHTTRILLRTLWKYLYQHRCCICAHGCSNQIEGKDANNRMQWEHTDVLLKWARRCCWAPLLVYRALEPVHIASAYTRWQIYNYLMTPGTIFIKLRVPRLWMMMRRGINVSCVFHATMFLLNYADVVHIATVS